MAENSIPQFEEIWKPILGYEGLYEVSNFGRIKSLQRFVKNKYGYRNIKERILIASSSKTGYLCITLRSASRKIAKTFFIHRLVMSAFVGVSDLDVNHKDRNPKNSKLQNLEYCSKRENTLHYIRRSGESGQLPGAYKDKRKKNYWFSMAYKNGVQKFLGSFNTEIEAHLAYCDFVGECKYLKRIT